MEIKFGLDIVKENCSSWSLKTKDKHCKKWVSLESLKQDIKNEISTTKRFNKNSSPNKYECEMRLKDILKQLENSLENKERGDTLK